LRERFFILVFFRGESELLTRNFCFIPDADLFGTRKINSFCNVLINSVCLLFADSDCDSSTHPQSGGCQSVAEECTSVAPSSGSQIVRSRFGRCTSSVSGGGAGGATSAAANASTPNAVVQLVSLPQLDSIQRTLRILDVRLQHVQSNARDDAGRRSDIEHIRRLMTENQNALSTVVTVLSSIQEEVRRISISVHHQQHGAALHIQSLQHKQQQLQQPASGVSSRQHSTRAKSTLTDDAAQSATGTTAAAERKAGTCVFIGSSELPGAFV
jgi:hypothetical protein